MKSARYKFPVSFSEYPPQSVGIAPTTSTIPRLGFCDDASRRVFAHALLGRRLPGEQGQDGGQRHGDSGLLERHSHRPFVFETGDRSETGLYERAC